MQLDPTIIVTARTLVAFFISGIAYARGLQAAALDQKKIATHLALTQPIARYLTEQQITIPQLERWIMETIAREAK